MRCPWLKLTTIHTDSKSSYNTSKRVEHQEFDKCMKLECPYYAIIDNSEHTPVCNKVRLEMDLVPIIRK